MPNPVFTLEHIRGLSEDTIMDITPAVRDLNFSPQPLQPTLLKVLDQIINDREDLTVPSESINMRSITETRLYAHHS